MHAFRPTNELARMDFSISPEGDVRWYTGTFSTDEKIAGREDLCGEHYAVPAVHARHLENNTCFAHGGVLLQSGAPYAAAQHR